VCWCRGNGGGDAQLSGRWARPLPFTPAQYEELEQQALIYKYLVAGVPVPPDLVVPIRRGLDSLATRFYGHPTRTASTLPVPPPLPLDAQSLPDRFWPCVSCSALCRTPRTLCLLRSGVLFHRLLSSSGHLSLPVPNACYSRTARVFYTRTEICSRKDSLFF
jgi:hypothetical protein